MLGLQNLSNHTVNNTNLSHHSSTASNSNSNSEQMRSSLAINTSSLNNSSSVDNFARISSQSSSYICDENKINEVLKSELYSIVNKIKQCKNMNEVENVLLTDVSPHISILKFNNF